MQLARAHVAATVDSHTISGDYIALTVRRARAVVVHNQHLRTALDFMDSYLQRLGSNWVARDPRT